MFVGRCRWPNKIARASRTLRPSPPPASGIAQTSCRGTSLSSAWQRRLSFWNSAGLIRMPTSGLSLRRRALRRAQGRDARFTDAPDLLEAPPVHRIRTGNPVTQEPAVQFLLVCTDLIDGDRFLMEKVIDRRRARGHPRDVDPSILVTKVAVRGAQHPSHAGRIPLAHLVDTECELHVNPLFSSQLGEKRMFRRAGTAPLLEHQPKLRAVGDSPIAQSPHMAGRRSEVMDSRHLKQRGERPVCRERPIHGLCPGYQAACGWAVAMNRLTATGSK